ncbi:MULTISPECIES: glycosyltransferase [Altibacter]|uniref:glycosyltransferase n=1 Tax=Altibacter TaxID=1535231 RepID=UPI00055135D2|nr:MULTISPECIES: glycosyltransferase [Altibacter]MCW9037493.1 glycosyltransferase [Altibacter sp.]
MTQHAPKRKFKVCLVSISLAGGGAERSCAMLSEMLSEHGHEVHIAILNDAIDYPYAGRIFNLGRLKGKKETTLRRFLRIRKLRRYIRKERFDIIIDHRGKNDYRREVFYAKYVYKGERLCYVVHSANPNLYLTEYPGKAAEMYNNNLLTVGVSSAICKHITKNFGIRNCKVIHNAFDPNWNASDDNIPAILQNKKYVLSYGRIEDSVKDFSFLIDAFSLSEAYKRNCYLVIMGEGRDKAMLQQKAAGVNGGSHILFLPFTNLPFSFIKHAHAVTLTSKYEGFPMVLVESLSVGVPVIALDIVSGPSEIVLHEENGLLVPKREESLFAQAISRMCFDESLYLHCKSRAKETVEAFSKEQIAAKWDQLLQDEL